MFDVNKIGYSFLPFTATVERAKIRELALAIGDTNPIYQSQQAAQTEGYQDTPLPPTIATAFLFWANTHFPTSLHKSTASACSHRENTFS